MSLMSVRDLACPKCGHKQETEVWQSVNVSLDPKLREKLLRGEINVFKCRSCQNSALIETPLLYNDMSRRYCVQYYPFRLVDQPEFLRQFNENAKIDIDFIQSLYIIVGGLFCRRD